MLERKLFEEIPGGKNVFHSAILTSYSFNFHHFEHQVLRAFKKKWITSINVLIDENILNDSLGLTTANLNSLSKTYAVSGLPSRGVFHPKINFFIGDYRLLVLVGSGNITAGGHGKNHEIFSGFFADEKTQIQLPIILEIWNYILSISKALEGYSLERVTKVLPSSCKLLKKSDKPKHTFHKLSKSLEVALVYTDDISLFSQITKLVPSGSIDKITIVCPYFDSNGYTLELLAKHFYNSIIEVFLQKENGLPPIEMPKNKRINFFNFDFTERGKKEISGKIKYVRKLHSKIIYFESKKEKYCLVGSPNATKQAFGDLTEKSANYEFGALYKSKSFDFIKELGLSNRKVPIDIYRLSRSKTIQGDSNSVNQKFIIKIKSLDLNGLNLKIYFEKKISSPELYIIGFGLNDKICFLYPLNLNVNLVCSVRLNNSDLTFGPQYCAIVDKEINFLSNKLPINYLDKLQNTNPSYENRSIRQILTSIESETFNEFEIAEFLNSLEIDRIERLSNLKPIRSSKKKEIEEITDGSGLTYEEAIAIARLSSDPLSILNTNSTTRIWHGIENIFNSTRVAISEEQMDEEELGDANISRDRKIEEIQNRKNLEIQNKSKGNFYLGSIEKMVKNYCEELKRLSVNKEHKIDTIDYHKYLLVSYILNKVCFFTVYDFPNEENTLKQLEKDRITSTEWNQKLNNLYYQSILDILKGFAILHHKNPIKRHSIESFDSIAQQNDAKKKCLYYLIFSSTLLNKNKYEEVLMNWTSLRVLNLFKKCGTPNNNLKDFIESVLKTYSSTYISSNHITSMNEHLLNQFASPYSNYVWTVTHGFSKVLEIKNKKAKIDTLYGIYYVPDSIILR